MKVLYWAIGALGATLALTLTEGSLIITTKLFGVTKATLLRVIFTIPLSWIVIYLATRSTKNLRFVNWLTAKEAQLSRSAQVAINGGKFFAVLNTTIFLGPIVASVLMLMFGLESKRIYIYSAASAFLCAWVWCAFYSGLLTGLGKILVAFVK